MKRKSSLLIGYKLLMGGVGVMATLAWLAVMVVYPVGIIVNGEQVAGPVVFGMILLGNGYGIWCLGKSGLDDLKEDANGNER